MTNLIKSHRAIGIERDRTDTYVIIETSPEPGNTLALKAISVQPGTLQDVQMQLRFEIADLFRKAQFLGLDVAGIQAVVTDELAAIEQTTEKKESQP